MGLSSFYMFLLDLLGIPVNNTLVLLGGELMLCVLLGLFYFRKHRSLHISSKELLRGIESPGWDITYYLAMTIILLLVFVISLKALFWPVATYDAVTGYDLLGRIIAIEGTLDNTVFDKTNSLENNRTGYPPLYPYNLAFAHITGAINPKIVSVFFYSSMAVCFYSLLRNYITPLGSALFTLLMISAPDYADFSSLTSNNTPLAFYAGLGLICMFIWYDRGSSAHFRLGTALIAFAMWDRAEAVFFFAAAALLVLIRSVQNKRFLNLILFVSIGILPAIVWQLYLRYILEAIVGIHVRTYLFWDPERIRIMAEQVQSTTFSEIYWGIAIKLCLVLIVINLIITLVKRKMDKWALVICTFISWILYMVLFYQMEADFEAVGWILYSYKRGLYAYLPPLVFGVAVLWISGYAFGAKRAP
jgi:hypothetical protein